MNTCEDAIESYQFEPHRGKSGIARSSHLHLHLAGRYRSAALVCRRRHRDSDPAQHRVPGQRVT
jgi:hypothetical protein